MQKLTPDKAIARFQIQDGLMRRYNDLLWKNFVAYGATLVAIAQLFDKQSIKWLVEAIGTSILALLSLIQIGLLKGHLRTIKKMKQFESANDFGEFISGPYYFGVSTAYVLISLAMVVLPAAMMFWLSPWEPKLLVIIYIVIACFFAFCDRALPM